MSTAIISGSQGLVGSEVFRRLQVSGWDVRGIDNEMRYHVGLATDTGGSAKVRSRSIGADSLQQRAHRPLRVIKCSVALPDRLEIDLPCERSNAQCCKSSRLVSVREKRLQPRAGRTAARRHDTFSLGECLKELELHASRAKRQNHVQISPIEVRTNRRNVGETLGAWRRKFREILVRSGPTEEKQHLRSLGANVREDLSDEPLYDSYIRTTNETTRKEQHLPASIAHINFTPLTRAASCPSIDACRVEDDREPERFAGLSEFSRIAFGNTCDVVDAVDDTSFVARHSDLLGQIEHLSRRGPARIAEHRAVEQCLVVVMSQDDLSARRHCRLQRGEDLVDIGVLKQYRVDRISLVTEKITERDCLLRRWDQVVRIVRTSRMESAGNGLLGAKRLEAATEPIHVAREPVQVVVAGMTTYQEHLDARGAQRTQIVIPSQLPTEARRVGEPGGDNQQAAAHAASVRGRRSGTGMWIDVCCFSGTGSSFAMFWVLSPYTIPSRRSTTRESVPQSLGRACFSFSSGGSTVGLS